MNPTSDSDANQFVENRTSVQAEVRQPGFGKFLHLTRFNIGPRLVFCFLVIVALMLAGDGLLLWQFHLVHVQGRRLTAVGEELIAVSRFQTDFFRLNTRLDELAKSRDIDGLRREAKPLREALLNDIDQTRNVISHLPAESHSDPTILPTLEAIQSTLPSQLEKVTALAEASDWEAVRLRLANEQKPLEAEVSALVRAVEQQVSTELTAELVESARVQQRILVIVPLTAAFTLMVAAFLGLVITSSITRPLARLVEGSTALAKGDFSHRVPATGNDEIARLGAIFNDMIVKLQEVYRDLQASETYLAEAQKLSHTGSFGWDTSGGDIYWSAETFRIFDFEPTTTVTVDAILRRTHAEDRSTLQKVIERASRDRIALDVEHRLHMPDGSIKYLRVVGRPSANEGIRRKFVGAVTDITDRKKAEEALRSSQRNLSLIINTMPTLAWSARPNGSVDFLNQRWLDYTGLSPEKALDWGWTEAIHPDDLSRLTDYWQSIMQTGEPGETESRLRRFDGEYRWFLFRANGVRDESGAIVKWYGTNTDIEDRKQAEAQVEQAYLRLAEAQRLSKTGSFITDLLADDHDWSEEAFRIFEFDPSTKVSVQQIRDIVHPEDLPTFDAVIARGMTGTDVDFVFRIMPRGVVKHIRGMARLMAQVGGRPLFIGALQDVTESKVAEEALDRARSDLAHVARVTTLNALTASIAHEINQPLSGIITNASTCLRMLNGDPPNVDGARETVRRTLRDGNRASDVITRLRALFSKKEFTPESLDLNDATREVIALSLSDLQRNRVILRSEFAEDIPPVIGDRVQLQQVALNLLRNASDAMAGIEDRPRQLLIRTRREGDDRVLLSVQDAGTGINPNDVERLFEAFYTTKSGGMGIGLSVSRSIIERHQGRLWAELNDGPGVTFSFSIPCGPESAPGGFTMRDSR